MKLSSNESAVDENRYMKQTITTFHESLSVKLYIETEKNEQMRGFYTDNMFLSSTNRIHK
jgi:hypothetical protein